MAEEAYTDSSWRWGEISQQESATLTPKSQGKGLLGTHRQVLSRMFVDTCERGKETAAETVGRAEVRV